MIATIWFLAVRFFAKTPRQLGIQLDGDVREQEADSTAISTTIALPGRTLWANRSFLTYACGFTLGLFVQVGIIAHLVSLLAPTLGAQGAGWAAGVATACAIIGRLLIGWLLPLKADRRLVAAATYLMQAFGCIAFIIAGNESIVWLSLGIMLFGFGIGNVTSLPPLIAQAEFAESDVSRAIALATAIAQATYAFAPAVFGMVRIWSSSIINPLVTSVDSDSTLFFTVAAFLQVVAAMIYLIGRP